MEKSQSKRINQEYYKGMVDETYRDSIIWKFLITIFDFFIYFFFPKKKASLELIDDLKKEVANYKKLNYSNSQAYNDWVKHANRVREMIFKKDPSMFLRWYPIRNTMNVSNSRFIIEELNDLKKSPYWDSLWKNTIIDTKIGGQLPFILYPKSSGNTIHLTYVISKFNEKTDKKFSDLDFIFEFGGGYGNLCRLIHKLGFRGKYIIFDLPIFSALQKFYLKLSGLQTYERKEIYANKNGIFFINNKEDVKLFEEGLFNKNKNLFIATWSLSETSLNNREMAWKILSNFNYFMIGYQDKFGEIDNRDYFNKLKKEYDTIIWYDWPLKQLTAHNLLIGEKK